MKSKRKDEINPRFSESDDEMEFGKQREKQWLKFWKKVNGEVNDKRKQDKNDI